MSLACDSKTHLNEGKRSVGDQPEIRAGATARCAHLELDDILFPLWVDIHQNFGDHRAAGPLVLILLVRAVDAEVEHESRDEEDWEAADGDIRYVPGEGVLQRDVDATLVGLGGDLEHTDRRGEERGGLLDRLVHVPVA